MSHANIVRKGTASLLCSANFPSQSKPKEEKESRGKET
jgi:hypothetical protein